MIEEIFYSTDWELFSWIATPLISLLAFFFYGAALFTSIKQNKITTSTSLIPYYEEEIENVIEIGKNLEIIKTPNGTIINGFNFSSLFKTTMFMLHSDQNYERHVEEGNFNALQTLKDLQERSYGDHIVFLNHFFSYRASVDYYSDLSKFLREVFKLILTIEASELTASHQRILKSKIRKKLAQEFLNCYWHLKLSISSGPKEIPIFVKPNYNGKEELVLKKIEETEFFKVIQMIYKRL